MEFDIGLVVVLFLIGFLGSAISGMVGIGGSIIKYPMLLYLPPLFGYAAFTAQEVSAISAVQVFFATLAAMFVFKKGGYIHKQLVLYMGGAIIIGSFIGAYGSKFLPNNVINIVYAVLALTAAIMMLFPKKGDERGETTEVPFHKGLAILSSGVIGIVAGIVGAAGAFITVPVMLVLLKIPTRVAIGSSLAITFFSSIGSTVGKLLGGHMLLMPSVVMVVASLIAAPLGANVSKKMNTKALQSILLVLIIGTVVKIWTEILF
ncbi:sulfite exporter TauE/SafE family protein [Schinkia sp. CFF1]